MGGSIDLNRLHIFKEVAVAGSFSKAAAQLRQPKSRVSRQIAALEKELGVQLIYRTTRNFRLTQSGHELYDLLQNHLGQLHEGLERLSSSADEISGTIRVTVPEDLGVHVMGRLCQDFMAAHPKVFIDLHVGNEVIDLVKDSFDVAIRVGRAKDSSLIQKRIGPIALTFVISPQLRARAGSLHRLEDLASLPYLSFAAHEMKQQSVRVTNGRETQSVKLRPVFSSNNFFVLRSMAIQATGLALLPTFLAQEAIADGRLVQIFKDWQAETTSVQILIPEQREVPVRIRRFMDFMSQRLSSILG